MEYLIAIIIDTGHVKTPILLSKPIFKGASRFHINVWCGLFGDQLFGLFVIEGKLNVQKYRQILLYVENFVEELPLVQYNRVYFQQDGATPHNATINANLLDTIFGDRWIGT
jgi:hypothetical protein